MTLNTPNKTNFKEQIKQKVKNLYKQNKESTFLNDVLLVKIEAIIHENKEE